MQWYAGAWHLSSQWEKFLFEAVHRETPPGFSRPSLLQIVRCDKAAFSRLGSTMTSIRQNADGSYPLGEELLKLRSDPHIALYLMPSAKQSYTSAASHQGPRTHPYSSGGHTTKGKGGGKTKSKQKGSPPIPSELRGKWHKTPSGDPITDHCQFFGNPISEYKVRSQPHTFALGFCQGRSGKTSVGNLFRVPISEEDVRGINQYCFTICCRKRSSTACTFTAG